jgi:hypothetical protein
MPRKGPCIYWRLGMTLVKNQNDPAPINAMTDAVSSNMVAAAKPTPIMKGTTYLSSTLRKTIITHTPLRKLLRAAFKATCVSKY